MNAAGVWSGNYDVSFRRIYTKQDYVDLLKISIVQKIQQNSDRTIMLHFLIRIDFYVGIWKLVRNVVS